MPPSAPVNAPLKGSRHLPSLTPNGLLSIDHEHQPQAIHITIPHPPLSPTLSSMPSDLSYWLISSPHRSGDDQALYRGVKTSIPDNATVGVIDLEAPALKAGTLSGLLTLSDAMPKHDTYFTGVVSKLLDTVRSLVETNATKQDDIQRKLEQYLRIDERSADDYLIPLPGAPQPGWRWDKSRWGTGGKVQDVVDALAKEMASIDATQKQKLQAYNLAKGQLQTLQRKRTGNLSTRSLVDVVKREDVVTDSEYMETLLVAVPKNNVKDWTEGYERLTPMVVPRSSQRLAADDEYVLFSVTLFKKIKDEFIHKCRERKFHAREFTYDEKALDQQNTDLETAAAEEKELWTDLLRLSRTNFSEAYQVLVHFKVVRLFVESVLRYGLPAEYSALVVRPEPKTSLKTLKAISHYFEFLKTEKGKGGGGSSDDTAAGEWGAVMEQEYYDFVLFEVPKVVTQ